MQNRLLKSIIILRRLLDYSARLISLNTYDIAYLVSFGPFVIAFLRVVFPKLELAVEVAIATLEMLSLKFVIKASLGFWDKVLN